MKQKRFLTFVLALTMVLSIVGTSFDVFAVDYIGGGDYTVKLSNIGKDDKLIFTYTQEGEEDEIFYIKEAGVEKDFITFVNVKQGGILVGRYRNEEYPNIQMGIITVSHEEVGQPQQITIQEADEPYMLTAIISRGGEIVPPEISIGDFTIKFESAMLAFTELMSPTLGNTTFDASGVAEYIGIGEGNHDWDLIMGEVSSGTGKVLVNDGQVGVSTNVEIEYMGNMKVTVNKVSGVEQPSNIQVFVDNIKVNFPDTQPKLIGDKLLVPIRFVNQDLGADVYWEPIAKKVIIDRDGVRIIIQPNNNTMFVNGKGYPLSSTPIIENGRILLPTEDIVQAYSNVFLEVEGSFIANYTTTGIEPDGYTGEAKLEGIPERTDYSTVGLVLLDTLQKEYDAITEAGNGEEITETEGQDNAIIINTEVMTSIIAFTITDSADILVNVNAENLEDRVITPKIYFKSLTRGKIDLSLKGINGDFFENVYKEDYEWDKISKRESMKYLAIGLTINDESEWESVDNKDIYAKAIEDAKNIDPDAYIKFGSIKPMGEVVLEFLVHHGTAIAEAINTQYKFTYRINFTE